MPVVRELLVKLGFRADTGGMKRAERQIDRTTGALKRMKMMASAVNTALLRMASGYLGLMGVMTLGRELFSTIASFETLRIRLETLTGSAEAAEAKFKMLRELAKTMPFQLQELTDAAVQLGLRGFDTSAESLRNLGNIAAGFGMSYKELSRNILSITRRQLEGFNNLGISASFAGDKIHVEFNKVKKTIDNNVESIQAYLNEVSQSPKFAGAAAKQMNSVAGMISNMKDALAEFAYEVGQAGVLDAMKSFLKDIGVADQAGGNLAKQLGTFLANAIRALGKVLRTAIRYFRLAVGAMESFYGVLDSVLTQLGVFDGSMQSAGDRVKKFGYEMLRPFVLLEDMIAYLQGRPSVMGFAEMDGEKLTRFEQWVVDLRKAVEENWPHIVNAFQMMGDDIAASFDVMSDSMAGWIADVVNQYQYLWAELSKIGELLNSPGFFSGMFEAFMTLGQSVKEFNDELFKAFMFLTEGEVEKALVSMVGGLVKVVARAMDGISLAIATGLNAIIDGINSQLPPGLSIDRVDSTNVTDEVAAWLDDNLDPTDVVNKRRAGGLPSLGEAAMWNPFLGLANRGTQDEQRAVSEIGAEAWKVPGLFSPLAGLLTVNDKAMQALATANFSQAVSPGAFGMPAKYTPKETKQTVNVTQTYNVTAPSEELVDRFKGAADKLNKDLIKRFADDSVGSAS